MADQRTTASYRRAFGVRYDITRGFFGPVEATVCVNIGTSAGAASPAAWRLRTSFAD